MYLIIFFRSLFRRIVRYRILGIIGILLSVGSLLTWMCRASFFHTSDVYFNNLIIDLTLLLFLLIVWSIYVFICCDFPSIVQCNQALSKIGLINRLDETPLFMSKETSGNHISLMFYSPGVSVETWNNKLSDVENVFNITISEIIESGKHNIITVKGCLGLFDWEQTYLPDYSIIDYTDRIQLGISPFGSVDYNLHTYPHTLIGGATFSGKTYLLKLILFQCVKKGYRVNILDFKGGIDFPRHWHENCNFISDETNTLSLLDAVYYEMQDRIHSLSLYGAKDIDKYNELHSCKMSRIIVACDEIAELLDTRGKDKEYKELVKNIENRLSSIARLGRAPGIHLILATQRGEADILSGQIKANLTQRICGTADNMLSMITLDNTDAATRVPKKIPGVFLNQDGTLFKSYLFDEIGSW